MRTEKLRLLDEFQRDFPLCPRPYVEIGERLGLTEAEVIVTLRQFRARGCVSRVGATIVPGRVGAATLATMAVPVERLGTVAELVNSYPEVNHNYERDHEFNLWFVVTASREARVQGVVREIERRARSGRVLDLPMVESYHVDLGFRLNADDAVGRRTAGFAPSPISPAPYRLAAPERALLAALQEGVPLTARPYAEIGLRAGMSEDAVMATLARLLRERVIGRLGVIVRHRELGYRANAMVVWDVPNAEARAAGSSIARADYVTLCYRRLRYLPHWPYNLYCMIHGTSRDAVATRIGELTERCGLERYPRAVLFSRRCFKQRGARYVEEVNDGRYRSKHRESAARRVSHF